MEQMLICEICRKPYNLDKRKPFVRTCCYKTACLECLKNFDAEQFECQLCKKKEFKGQGLNEILVPLVQVNQKSIIVMCDDHPERNAEYCTSQMFACDECYQKCSTED